MDEEDVGQMIDGIEKIAQCPVCLELAKAPVAQCCNGHICCGPCREPLEECSMCREPFIETVNRIVEELLNFLPKPCPYTNKGCKDVSLLDNHSQYCEFRPIKCLVGKDQLCAWTGTINEWKQHLKTEHSEYAVTFDDFEKPAVLLFDDIKADWHSCCYYYSVNEESFLFHVWKEGNKFCHNLKHVQRKKTKQEYYFKVKFVSQELLFYKSLTQSAPFKEGEPLKENPVVFLLADLSQITKEDGRISVEVEAIEIDMPKKK